MRKKSEAVSISENEEILNEESTNQTVDSSNVINPEELDADAAKLLQEQKDLFSKIESDVSLKNPNMSIIEDGSFLTINFEKIFNKSGLSVYHDFDLRAKRNFKNIAKLIGNTYDDIFFLEHDQLDPDMEIALFNILDLKYQLMTEDISLDNFIEKLDHLVNGYDGLLLKKISNFVDKTYVQTLDEITEVTKQKNKKVNTQLQMTDKHAIILSKAACLFRVIVPLVSEFFIYNKNSFPKTLADAEDEDLEDVQLDQANDLIFNHFLEVVAGKDFQAVKNKVFKLVSSRLSRTIYSDKRFWSIARTHGITKDSESVSIYKKLITIAIPKLLIEPGINVVSFLQSIVNNQIDFLLQNKFRYSIEVINNNKSNSRYSKDDDEDDNTEYEQIEANMLKADDGMSALRLISIQERLSVIRKAFDVEVTNDEVQEFAKVMRIHHNQVQIVGFLTYKFFADKHVLKFLSYTQYCALLLCCKKYMEKHNFTILPKVLVSKAEKLVHRIPSLTQKIVKSIMYTRKYQTLCRLKYSSFSNELAQPIQKMVLSIYGSTFKDPYTDELTFEYPVSVTELAEECIQLAHMA